MASSHTDCRTDDGVTVGLVDSIITAARVLGARDLTAPAVLEALADLRQDEDVAALLSVDPAAGRCAREATARNDTR